MKNNPESLAIVEAMKPDLTNMLRHFLFEESNEETWRGVKTMYDGFLGTQEIHQWTVICDDVNNTPERALRGELWVDVAIRVNSDEMFIYVPLRLAAETIR